MEVTPIESFNRHDVLLGVTRAIAENEGKKKSSEEFNNALKHIEEDIFPEGGPRLAAAQTDRNVLRRQGRYWDGFGITANSKSGILRLTQFGHLLAAGEYSPMEFAAVVVHAHKLPNSRVDKEATVAKWNAADIDIKPLKIIIETLISLYEAYGDAQCLINPREIKDVLVPLSLHSQDPDFLANAVVAYRQDPDPFKELPNCAPDSNDERMIREHLLFLSNHFLIQRNGDQQKRKSENAYSISPLDIPALKKLVGADFGDADLAEIATDVADSEASPVNVRQERLIRQLTRPGQAKFRDTVLKNFAHQCLLTQETTPDVLQACHIKEVNDGGSDDVSNGICLRADLHILFDRNKLRISPNGRIIFAKSVSRSASYKDLPSTASIPGNIDGEALRHRFSYGPA